MFFFFPEPHSDHAGPVSKPLKTRFAVRCSVQTAPSVGEDGRKAENRIPEFLEDPQAKILFDPDQAPADNAILTHGYRGEFAAPNPGSFESPDKFHAHPGGLSAGAAL